MLQALGSGGCKRSSRKLEPSAWGSCPAKSRRLGGCRWCHETAAREELWKLRTEPVAPREDKQGGRGKLSAAVQSPGRSPCGKAAIAGCTDRGAGVVPGAGRGSGMWRLSGFLKVFARDPTRGTGSCRELRSSDALGQMKLGFYGFAHKIR